MIRRALAHWPIRLQRTERGFWITCAWHLRRPGFIRLRVDWWIASKPERKVASKVDIKPVAGMATDAAEACGKPGPNGIGACTRWDGHLGFCYAGTQPQMHALLVTAAERYPDNLNAQRAFLRASLIPGARVE